MAGFGPVLKDRPPLAGCVARRSGGVPAALSRVFGPRVRRLARAARLGGRGVSRSLLEGRIVPCSVGTREASVQLRVLACGVLKPRLLIVLAGLGLASGAVSDNTRAAHRAGSARASVLL